MLGISIIFILHKHSIFGSSFNRIVNVRDLGLLLNTGFSVGDNVARATKKADGMLFYLY